MYFQRIFTPGLGISTYLLGDEKTKQCLVIDPTRHVVPYIMETQNADLEIIGILETHVHADFVSGAVELKHQLNERPPIYASGMGGSKWIPAYTDHLVDSHTEISMGDLRLKALHTPGHTPEHTVWVCYDESRSAKDPCFVFTGDCLFVGSIGRPDLLGEKEMSGLAPQLYSSLFDVLGALPDFVEILPAHGEGSLCGKSLKTIGSSTLGYERLYNPYLKMEAKESWIKKLEEGLPSTPLYFQRIKQMNVAGPPLLKTLKVTHWDTDMGTPHFDSLFLLDIRNPEIFATSYLKGSLNIPLSPSFSQWAGWMIPLDLPIGMVVENMYNYPEAIDRLRLMGFDQDIWVIEQQMIPSFPTDSFGIIEGEELAKRQPHFDPFYIVDVRTPDEWNEGHILGAHHFELTHLRNSLDQLPRDQTLVLVCRSGHRASLAASLLKKQGFDSVMNLRGGMQTWKLSGFPIQKK